MGTVVPALAGGSGALVQTRDHHPWRARGSRAVGVPRGQTQVGESSPRPAFPGHPADRLTARDVPARVYPAADPVSRPAGGRLLPPCAGGQRSDWVHAVEAGGPAVTLCQRRVTRIGREQPPWDPDEPGACPPAAPKRPRAVQVVQLRPRRHENATLPQPWCEPEGATPSGHPTLQPC